ncbi:ABC-2 family transporter protein [Candidatus Acetothermia bacterium]|nr:ABC-2 family transporter protein [Candidatus Acetothermia bacterium]MBI3658899.1 ABC-2 family transporter protein [Candidatus Acetothermia bacterium]
MIEPLSLYFRLIGARVRSQMQYKFSFIADFIAACVGMIMEFVGVLILFTHMPALGGWTLAQMAFLYGTTELAFSLANILIEGFDQFPEVIRRGEFDKFLIRPRNTFFQILSSEFAPRRIGRATQAIFVLGAGLWWLHVSWGPEKWLFLVWTLLGGMVFYAGLFVIHGTFSFWTIEALETMNIFTYGGTTMASYPMNIFSEWMRNIFIFIIPLAFVNYFPALYLLDKPDPFGLPGFMPFLAFPLCSLVLMIGMIFWRVGVRHYQSTGN